MSNTDHVVQHLPTALKEENDRLKARLHQLEEDNERLLREKNHLYDLAYRDPLTGLSTRRVYQEVMDTLPHRVGPVSLVMVDLDNFHQINSKFGHSGGDQVLIRVGKTILDEAFDTDFCVRLGGEEFAIILRDCDESGAQKFAERLHGRIRDRVVHLNDGRIVKVTASLGYAQYRPGEDTRAFYDRVDQALYVAKSTGRDCIRLAR